VYGRELSSKPGKTPYLTICQHLNRRVPDDIQQITVLLDELRKTGSRDATDYLTPSLRQSSRYSKDQSLALHQLPTDIADFTGRQAELATVTTLMEQASQAQGTAVGISAVAGHAATQVRAVFPSSETSDGKGEGIRRSLT
jgi:hypothetical protein